MQIVINILREQPLVRRTEMARTTPSPTASTTYPHVVPTTPSKATPSPDFRSIRFPILPAGCESPAGDTPAPGSRRHTHSGSIPTSHPGAEHPHHPQPLLTAEPLESLLPGASSLVRITREPRQQTPTASPVRKPSPGLPMSADHLEPLLASTAPSLLGSILVGIPCLAACALAAFAVHTIRRR